MALKFLEGVGSGVAENFFSRFIKRVLGPALFFWGGGVLLLALAYGWQTILAKLLALDSLSKAVSIFVGLMVLTLTDILMEWSTLPLLQLIEGYNWPAFWYNRRIWRLEKRLIHKRGRLQTLRRELTTIAIENSSPEKLKHCARLQGEYIRTEAELMAYPANWNNLMPTLVGNILRAAEDYSRNRYGLDTVIVWSRLWLTLPKEVQDELTVARQHLNEAIQLIGWGMLFAVWSPCFGIGMLFDIWLPFTWWQSTMILVLPLIVAGLMILIIYQRVIQTAKIYSDLIRAVFDLYRLNLYRQCHWPLPKDSDREKAIGEKLTAYIYRGSSSLAISPITFEHTVEEPKE